ncbi:thioredoxin family protein [Nonomuraea sp. B10E15]|uniref:thioredoxin family protein n=1 Tax=Nonomuraea sp. B10E15 TaxID=3153560 RepID=UPI00325E512F
MSGLWVAVATLALGAVIGVVHLRRGGRMRDVGGERLPESLPGESPEDPSGSQRLTERLTERLTGADLGEGLGERATLVQFSTAFCQPCRATRRILADVSALVPGVSHVEIDAESRLDLVRRLGIMRTPTVLVLDAAGAVVRRASGQPRKADVLAAVADALPPG